MSSPGALVFRDMRRAPGTSRTLLGFDMSRGSLVGYALLGVAWLLAVMSFFLYKGATPGTVEEQRAANLVRVEDGKEPLPIEEESSTVPAIVVAVLAGGLCVASGLKLTAPVREAAAAAPA